MKNRISYGYTRKPCVGCLPKKCHCKRSRDCVEECKPKVKHTYCVNLKCRVKRKKVFKHIIDCSVTHHKLEKIVCRHKPRHSDTFSTTCKEVDGCDCKKLPPKIKKICDKGCKSPCHKPKPCKRKDSSCHSSDSSSSYCSRSRSRSRSRSYSSSSSRSSGSYSSSDSDSSYSY